MTTRGAGRPEAVLFDCDGTLLLTADLHYEGMAAACAAQGCVMPRAWYMSVTGLGRKDTFAQFAAEFDLALDHPRLVADSIANTAAMAYRTRVNPAVAALAQNLAGKLPIAVVTNSEAIIAHAFLRAANLHDLFNAILTVEDAALPKPDPALYLAAAAKLGAAIENCVVLEDSAQGLAAGTAAGATCIDVRAPFWEADARTRLAQGGALAPKS